MREAVIDDKSGLSERKKQILRAVVEAHIETGEPVGSKAIVEMGIPFSSATIRSEMAELEDIGYLEQPHTSSGRIPTKRGYHFYVNSLMNSYKLSAMETIELNNALKNKIGELDTLISGVSKLVSSLTNYTAVALTAGNKDDTVYKFSYMLLDQHSFLLVMRMADSRVISKQIKTSSYVDDTMLSKLIQLFNKHIAGITAKEITFSVMMEIEREMNVGADIVSPSVKAVYEAIGGEEEADIRFEGVNRLLEYPEFSDIGKVRGMLEMMENRSGLIKLLSEADSDKVNIYIGGDEEGLVDNSALIFKRITVGGKTVGAIGVLGPSRMDYSKVISTVDYLSRQISVQFGTALPPSSDIDDK
ncbi:MAG: heat-inducible transcription repressor HrcA [Clostridia bacterium]|nr:heat-inducible transcription repressor HrcA [Clostridia bacterium]